MKTKQQLREHLHTYAQIGVAVGLLMGAIDLWGGIYRQRNQHCLIKCFRKKWLRMRRLSS